MKIRVKKRLLELFRGDMHSVLVYLANGGEVKVGDDKIEAEFSIIANTTLEISKMLEEKTPEYFALWIIFSLYLEKVEASSQKDKTFYDIYNPSEIAVLSDFDSRGIGKKLIYYDSEGDSHETTILDFLLRFNRLSKSELVFPDKILNENSGI